MELRLVEYDGDSRSSTTLNCGVDESASLQIEFDWWTPMLAGSDLLLLVRRHRPHLALRSGPFETPISCLYVLLVFPTASYYLHLLSLRLLESSSSRVRTGVARSCCLVMCLSSLELGPVPSRDDIKLFDCYL